MRGFKPQPQPPKGIVGVMGHRFITTRLNGEVRGECGTAADARRQVRECWAEFAWEIKIANGKRYYNLLRVRRLRPSVSASSFSPLPSSSPEASRE